MNSNLHYISHDIEVYANAAFMRYKAKDSNYIGYIDLINERNKLIKFLSLFDSRSNIYDPSKILVGFNCLDFDIPVMILFSKGYPLDRIITRIKEHIDDDTEGQSFTKFLSQKEGMTIAKEIWDYIKNTNIIDLYKMHKWDDDSRRASLKWIGCNMNADTIQDNPYDINHKLTKEQLEEAKEYCKNDILLTERILNMSYEDIAMRNDIHKLFYDKYKSYRKKYKENVNPLYSKSKTSVASQIILEYVKEKTQKIIENQKTNYVFKIWDEIIEQPIKDYLCEEKELLEKIEPFVKSILHRNKELEYEFRIENKTGNILLMKLAKGGCHGFTEPSVVASNDDYQIIDFDVASFYPRIVLEYGLEPISLQGYFKEAYQYIYTERFKYPKGTTLNKAYKEALNSVIGLSNKPGTPFFDPMFFFKVTINGQLLTTILVHELVKKTNSDCIMANTDGATMYCKRTDIDTFYEICKEWEQRFKMALEYTLYDKMVIQHVNSYIAMSSKETQEQDKEISDIEWIKDGKHYKLKCKGEMVFSDKDIEYHKNNGLRIIPKAVAYYFFKNQSVVNTITEEPNKMLFLGYIRRNKKTKILIEHMATGEIIETPYKVIRFIYSIPNDKAITIMRDTKNGKVLVDKEHNYMYLCNKYDESEIKEKIDYAVYIKKTNDKIKELNKKYNTYNLFSTLI